MFVKIEIESQSKLTRTMEIIAEELIDGIVLSNNISANVKEKYAKEFLQHLVGLTKPGLDALRKTSLDVAYARYLIYDIIEQEIEELSDTKDISRVKAEDTVLLKFGVSSTGRYKAVLNALDPRN